MKTIRFIFFAILFPFLATAQVNKVNLQAAGLTCSMCSNSINKSLLSLSNVSKVETDLETSTFTVYFKNSDKANFDELKNKVENAGFSITKMEVEMNVSNLQIANETHVTIGDKLFHFVKVKDQNLNGNQTFTLVDKGFLPAKAFKTYMAATKMDCIKTGMMEACCKGKTGSRIYHVTI